MSGGDVDLAAVAGLIGDRTRSRMLVALLGGREISASLLADEAGVSPSTASGHLAKLVDGDLVAARTSGRHRHYRLASAAVAEVVERLVELAPAEEIGSLRASRRAAELRVARTCYDHLAGRVGVGLMHGLLQRGHLTGGDGGYEAAAAQRDAPASPGRDLDYRLTPGGQEFLDHLGVDLPQGRRALVRYCVDWTETRHHLGGRLGRGLRDRFLEAGWLEPRTTNRALRVTAEGRAVLAEEFGLDLSPS
ncbi:transcriptional regulator [Marmoricola endophyticus]|uniref:Transcriptional regulator n=1 Tax=Marmoricola endophyticus TaxID=2040280 RepID=A0A917BDC6_9ACTN|nr:winged helix-turn-helix domain-containing protein [Marmoricola endophyticus]GGF38581.1 transcriptional regulator [Marmoricola endophyticus]